MPISVHCPHCGIHATAPDARAGKGVTCGGCRQRYILPQLHEVPTCDGSEPVVQPAPDPRLRPELAVDSGLPTRRRQRRSNLGVWLVLGVLFTLAGGGVGLALVLLVDASKEGEQRVQQQEAADQRRLDTLWLERFANAETRKNLKQAAIGRKERNEAAALAKIPDLKMPKFDLSTFSGEREREEWIQRAPALQAVRIAEARLEAAKLSEAQAKADVRQFEALQVELERNSGAMRKILRRHPDWPALGPAPSKQVREKAEKHPDSIYRP
jgi:hypothetical protein